MQDKLLGDWSSLTFGELGPFYQYLHQMHTLRGSIIQQKQGIQLLWWLL